MSGIFRKERGFKTKKSNTKYVRKKSLARLVVFEAKVTTQNHGNTQGTMVLGNYLTCTIGY